MEVQFIWISFLISSFITYKTNGAEVQSSLVDTLVAHGQANVLISFVGGNSHAIQSTEARPFNSRQERIEFLSKSLKANAESVQQNVQRWLHKNSIKYKSFWVSNQIYVTGVDQRIVNSLSHFPEIREIHKEIQIPMHAPGLSNCFSDCERPNNNVEWNIAIIQAEEAWQISSGAGVVVANIDSGVRYTHESLRHNFRGIEYGWYNPYERNEIPFDDDGHGTHTMGTIVGSKGIGVAPNATWITCRGCNITTCTEANLIECGQWILCPTKSDGSSPNCSMAPAVVSNSWGIGVGDSWYEAVTEAWVAAGIINIFALGNSGPTCGTTNSPGDYESVIGVGATTVEDRLYNRSSLGPTIDGRLKPELTAPGESILSAVPDSDTAYILKSGTSMASPHVAGVAALLLSITPDLTFAQVRDALTAGVDVDELIFRNESCEGRADNTFPNHHFGHGRINALKVVQMARLITT